MPDSSLKKTVLVVSAGLFLLACSLFSRSSSGEDTGEGSNTVLTSTATAAASEAGSDPGDGIDTAPTPETAFQPPVRFIPFNYRLEDAGNGWNAGTIQLAIENTSGSVLQAQSFDFSGGAEVETLEGPTYPIVFNEVVRLGEVIEIPGPLPPGFRFTSVIYRDTSSILKELSWRSAVAATPQRVVFNGYPWLTFDLPASPEDSAAPGFPSAAPLSEVVPLTELDGTALENSQGVSVQFTDICVIFPAHIRILVNLTNEDPFNEVGVTSLLNLTLPVSLFNATTGVFMYREPSVETPNSLTLGPGQEDFGYFELKGTAVKSDWHYEDDILVIWFPDGTYRMFSTTGCLIG